MNPWELAKESEFSQQAALFCFCNKAIRFGFEAAMLKDSYENSKKESLSVVPELAFFHSVPNGVRSGNLKSRQIEGAALKATGVKAGVLDTFWPLRRGVYCGLYIEMKKPALKSAKNATMGCSDEQNEFGKFVTSQGYVAKVCYSWLEAAEVLQWYYQLEK